MADLQEKLECVNARFPRFRFRAVAHRSRRCSDFEKRPDFRAALIPDERDLVVYKVNGKTLSCKLQNLDVELDRHLSRLDTFEKFKEEMAWPETKVKKMGFDVLYRDTDDEILNKEPLKVESDFAGKYPSAENVLQVFRVNNGPAYAYITLLKKNVFIQKPLPSEVQREVTQAMVVNSFMRGSNTCPICMTDTHTHHVMYSCVMHAFCGDCTRKLLQTRAMTCPICRAASM